MKRDETLDELTGWIGIPASRDTGLLDENGKPLMEILRFPQHYRKLRSHQPGMSVMGAPKYGAFWANHAPAKSLREQRRMARAKLIPFKVWNDFSLRRADKLIKKQLDHMTPEQQAQLIQEATARLQKAVEEKK